MNETLEEEIEEGEIFGFTDMIYDRNRLERYKTINEPNKIVSDKNNNSEITVLTIQRDELLGIILNHGISLFYRYIKEIS